MAAYPPADEGHVPVLLNETLAALALTPGADVIDGTLGGAGHARYRRKKRTVKVNNKNFKKKKTEKRKDVKVSNKDSD